MKSKASDGYRLRNALRLIASMKPYAGEMAATAVCVLVKHLSTAGAALQTAWMVSSAVRGTLGDSFGRCMFWLCVCVVLRAITYFGEMLIGHDAAYKIQRDTRVRIFNKFTELAPAYLSRHPAAHMGTMAMGDIELLEWFIAHTFCSLIAAGLIMLVFFGVLLSVHAGIFLIVLVFAVVIAAIPFLDAGPIDHLGKLLREKTTAANSVIIEGIQGLTDFLAMDYLDAYKARKDRIEGELYDARYRYAGRIGGENALAQFLAGLLTVVIMLVCAVIVGEGSMPREMYPIMLVLSTFIFSPILEVSANIRMLGEMFAAADRIQRLFDEEPEVLDEGTEEAAGDHPDIEFCDVCFGYEKDRPVLKNVSFRARPGLQTALVGPSGAGKTTCANLLLRYYDTWSGSVRIGGTDVRKLRESALRDLTGAVLQEAFLFHISIKENIRLGKPDASDEEIIAAAKKAYAHDFIMELPEGYDTVTGERGFRLSGGQRQRISIARALLCDAPVLVLDEAVSNLDAENERLIETILKEDAGNRTTLVIAHRLSTIMNADELIVLSGGEVVQTGTHKELIRQEGFYKTLMEKQIKAYQEKGRLPEI